MAILTRSSSICTGAGKQVEPIVVERLGLAGINAVADGGDVTGIVVGVAEVLQVGAAAALVETKSGRWTIASVAVLGDEAIVM